MGCECDGKCAHCRCKERATAEEVEDELKEYA
ncbi:MAG: hypothetical protein C5S49_03970 [Candidatus Methanogaster sp.]|nr:MAG: hypothetical protein C5S49_03970 [ANME-2 cluster archaeon]